MTKSCMVMLISKGRHIIDATHYPDGSVTVSAGLQLIDIGLFHCEVIWG